MSSKMLYEAIALVRAGNKDDARQIIFEILRVDPKNEMAWMWLAETLSSDRDRLNVLKASLKYNPDSKIANMAIEKMREKMEEDGVDFNEAEAPFSSEPGFDPLQANRTGHTGALIGFDGSFILSEVSDFDEIIDLRSPQDGELDFMNTTIETNESIPASPLNEEGFDIEPDSPEEEVDFSKIFNQVEDETVEPEENEAFEAESVLDEEPQNEEVTSSEPSDELAFEPDLTELLAEEDIFMPAEDEPDLDSRLNFNESNSDQGDDINLNFNEKIDIPEEDLIDLDALSPEELGFDQQDQPGETTREDIAELEALLEEEDLVEEKVLESTVAKNKIRRKKQDRRAAILMGFMFIFIAALCAVAVFVIWNYSNQNRLAAYQPTSTIFPTSTDMPTATLEPSATITPTPKPTATPTMVPTPTKIVPLSELAISAAGIENLSLRLNQTIDDSFYTSLDGSLAAITDGGDVRVYDVARGKEIYALSGHDRAISDVVFSSDNRYMVTGAVDFTIRLWDLELGTQTGYTLNSDAINRIYTMENAASFPREVTVDFSPDGSTIAAGTFGIISIIDVPTGLTRGTFALTNEEINLAVWNNENLHGFDVRFNENGWVLTAGMSKLLVGLDTLDATLLYRYELGEQAILNFNENRVYFAEQDAGGISIRMMDTGEITTGFGGKGTDEQPLPSYDVSTNWERVAIVSGDEQNQPQLSVWDVFVDWNIINIPGICVDDLCRAPAFSLSSDGKLIAVELEGEDDKNDLQVINLDGLNELHRFSGLQTGVRAVDISPTGNLISALDEAGVLHVWDLEIGVERAAIQTNDAEFVQFSNNGQFLFAWNDDTLWAWSQPLPPPDNAFPGIQYEQLENWLLAQGDGIRCRVGDLNTETNWQQVECTKELESYSVITSYYLDEDGYLFELEHDLALGEDVALDEEIIADFAYFGSMNYTGAQPEAATQWISEQMPTLADVGSQVETSFGAIRFLLSRTETGYKLYLIVPDAAS
jgi:WD40 repeat protein